MEVMDHVGRNWSLYLAAFVTIFPVLSILGHLVSAEALKNLRDNPVLILYFMVMLPYGYFYWFDKHVLEVFLGLKEFGQFLVYVILSVAIIVERKIP